MTSSVLAEEQALLDEDDAGFYDEEGARAIPSHDRRRYATQHHLEIYAKCYKR